MDPTTLLGLLLFGALSHLLAMAYPGAVRTTPRRIGFVIATATVTVRIIRMEIVQMAQLPAQLFDTAQFLQLISYFLGMSLYCMILTEIGALVLVFGALLIIGSDILAIVDACMGLGRP